MYQFVEIQCDTISGFGTYQKKGNNLKFKQDPQFWLYKKSILQANFILSRK